MFSWLGSSSRTLPKPSGPFSVGFFDFEWSPPKSALTTDPPAFSLARVYYPSTPVASLDPGYEERCGKWIPSSDYLPSVERYGYYLKIPRLISASAFRWLAGHLKLRASENVPLHADRKLPVVIFSHGLGGIRTTYSTICTDLASHGFIVAAIEHRLLWRFLGALQRATVRLAFFFTGFAKRRFRDGSASMTIEQQMVKPYEHPEERLGETDLHQFRAKQLAFRAQEVSSTLDLLEAINAGNAPANLWRLYHPHHAHNLQQVVTSLKGKLDLRKVVMMGHSFGAATSFFAASRDPRIRSVVAMDPWMYPLPSSFAHKTQLPLLVINSETFHWKTNLETLKRLLQHNVELGNGAPSSHASMMVGLKGTGHMDQSDFTVALPPYVTERFRPGQTSDPVAVLRSNNDIILTFLKEKAGIELPSGAGTVALPKSEQDRAQFESNQSCTIDYM